MGAWPGKYVIGLTGNIATGKSEVRKMLQGLGASGIDADSIAHRVLSKDGPAYEDVLRTFGSAILSLDGQIDRTRLGQIVFSDPGALVRLEGLTQPHIRKMVFQFVQESTGRIVVIEAIKLIEAGYPELCDSVWVTYASERVQLERLVQQRGMTEAQARQRIAAQAPQESKLAVANVILINEGSVDELYAQVESHWQKIISQI